MPKINLEKHTLLLICILALATFLRVFQLTDVPSGFHADEASFYINAQALLTTGMDEDGRSFPLTLNSYIDPKPALFSYIQVPFVAVISNPVLASRLPSAVLGVVSIWLLYVFISKVSTKTVATVSALVSTISPWHIIVSRGTQEVILSFVLLLLFFISIHKLLFENNKNNLKISILYTVVGLFSAFLSGYVYHSAKILIPIIVLIFAGLALKKGKTTVAISSTISIAVIIAIIGSFFVQDSSARLEAVNIFTESGYQQQITEQIYSASGHANLTTLRIFYNKLQVYSFALVENYLEYFSPDFLFFEGSKPTRYQIPNHGLLYLIELPLLLLGLYFAIKKSRKFSLFFWLLLLLAPLPAAVTTQETPSMIRSFTLFIPLIYFISLGITQVLKLKNQLLNFLLILILIAGYIWSIGYFSMQYSIQATYTEPWYRNSPYTKIAQSVEQLKPKYETVQVTNDLRPLYAYFVMYNTISIESLQQQPLARNNEVYTVDDVTFTRAACEFSSLQPNTLYIAEVGCREQNQAISKMSLVETITYEDGTPVYELLEITN